MQFAVVDVDLRARFPVDRYFLAVDPDARRQFEQFDAVLADRSRGVGHVHHETVGFAPDQLSRHHHLVDAGRRTFQREVAQVVALFHAHLPGQRFVAQVEYRKGVVARRNLQREAAFGVGGHAGYLFAVLQQHDRGIFHGLALFGHHAARGRVELCRCGFGCKGGCRQCDDQKQ